MNIKFIIFAPFVILHELSHLVFITLAGCNKHYVFKMEKDRMGFYPKGGERFIDVYFFQAILLTLCPIAPLGLYIASIALFITNNGYTPFVPNVWFYILFVFYYLYGTTLLFPSRGDWETFKTCLKQLI